MEKLNMQTTDVVDENIKRIGELFSTLLEIFFYLSHTCLHKTTIICC